ncbi:MAG TPA: DUF3750 domain-containing protein [Burkholderiales bacterium]|nr:DUF3750 domain-containing protein [Burkholderiales bacterium]
MKLRRTMLLVVVLFVLPIAISIATHTPAAATWQTASRAPTGLAPDPALVREPVVQVYAARTFGWRGAFGVHSWIAVKRADADTYTRYDVVFWGGPPHVRRNYAGPDALWFGSRPDVLVDRRGEGVEALIDQIEAAVQRYPFNDAYRTWPGPNSNTFVAHIGRSVPGLALDLPANAIGKDYQPLSAAIGPAPSGAGVQVSLFGLLGVIVAPEEGLEFNVLGLSLGVDVAEPALRLPGLGRVGAGNSAD